MTKHACDDCGADLTGMWWDGARFGEPELELCQRCYRKRVEARTEPASAEVKEQG